MDILKDFIMLCGIGFIGIFSSLIIISIKEFITDSISDLKWNYKRKHRFDKPPIAECYCKDCIYYSVHNSFGKCTRGNINKDWNIADSWFCWAATPHKKDPEIKRNK